MAPRVENTVRVEGLNQLLRTLEKLQEEAKEEFKAAAVEAGDLVRDQARIEAPHLTGRLESAIVTAKIARGVKVRVSKAVPYAKAIHFGWPKHNIVPNRFMFRAVDAKADEAADLYMKRILAVWEAELRGQ